MLLILITTIFFIIPTKTIIANPRPLINVPLDSWVYATISRLETLQAFEGNDLIALNTKPLTRLEIAFLIDTVLSNLQRGKLELNQQNLSLMDKLVQEFQDELASIGVKIIPLNLNSSDKEILKSFSPDWLYDSLKYFEERNILKAPSSRLLNPQMSRKDMALLLDEIIFSLQTEQIQVISLTEEDLEKLEALLIELDNELSAQGLKIVKLNKTTIILDTLRSTLTINPYFTQKMDLFYSNSIQNKDKSQNQKNQENKISTNQLYSFSELGAVFSGSFSENSAFYLDASASTDFEFISTFPIDGVPLKAQLNQAYIKLKLPSFEIPIPSNTTLFSPLSNIEIPPLDLLAGRDYMKWGPGHQGNLILSDNPPAFNMLKYSGTIDLNNLGGDFGKVNFTKFFSLIDPLDGQNRYFLGQRLEYKPLDTLTIGLSETAIISQDSSILFFNPLPFIPPYYAIQEFMQIFRPENVNCNVALDAEINLTQKIKLYGEWMADDFIFFPDVNPYPNRTGFLTGAYFADPLGSGNTDFRIEYAHINNYVYFPTYSWQNYLYQNEYMGHPLGPDADQLYLELSHRLSDKFNLSLNYNQEHHGEGQTGIPLPSDPVIANENIFLSGIIEKQQAYHTELSYTISPEWELSAGITWESIKNKDNDIGVNENNIYFQMELNYQF